MKKDEIKEELEDQQEELKLRQEELLKALKKSKGRISKACEAIGAGRATHYRYVKESVKYAEAYDDILEGNLDGAEDNLEYLMNQRTDLRAATTSTIFYLKTKGKKRGYIERTEIEEVNKEQQKRTSDLFPDDETLDRLTDEMQKKPKS